MAFPADRIEVTDRYLKENPFENVEFMRGSYRAFFRLPQEEVVLLELDDEGFKKSSFCTCGQENCQHVLSVFRFATMHYPVLHLRYERSVWKKLFISLDSQERELSISEKKISGKGVLIETKGDRSFTSWAEELENDENHSFKMAALTPAERKDFTRGRATSDLVFAFSFFSDLSKYLFILDALGKKTSFVLVPKGPLPQKITFISEEIKGEIELLPEEMVELFPLLFSCDVLPKVDLFCEKKLIDIEYDAKERCLIPHFISLDQEPISKSFSGWNYFSQSERFCPSKPLILLEKSKLYGEDVTLCFEQHLELMLRYLQTPIQVQALTPKIDLFFDANRTFHIEGYVFEKGDVEVSFGRWIYVKEKGFFCVESLPPFWPKIEVTSKEIDAFLSQNRHWITQFEGFAIHLYQIEPSLHYQFLGDRFVFTQEMFGEGAGEILDLGVWIYVKGQGFFEKKSLSKMGSIYAGLTIAKNKMTGFIEQHKEELQHVRHFFIDRERVIKIAVYIHHLGLGKFEIEPHIQWAGSTPDSYLFFGRFVFVEKEGFYQLPEGYYLPETLSKSVVYNRQEMALFLQNELPHIRKMIAHLDPALKPVKDFSLHVAKVEAGSEVGSWSLDLYLETSTGRVGLQEVLQAAKEGKELILTSAGLVQLAIPPISNWLFLFRRASITNEGVELGSLDWLKIASEIDFVLDKGAAKEGTPQLFLDWLHSGFDPSHVVCSLKGLVSQLRPYQEEGVKWLFALYYFQLSGFLCDEMGLGKTHQVMGLIAAICNVEKAPRILVVAPTSVIYHWQALLEKFLPDVLVIFFHGRTRPVLSKKSKASIVLTSYGILRTELEKFSSKEFDLIVFDELQIAKNRQSQVYKALCEIQGRTKIGLTGTPLENHLLELKALFDLLLPGYLPPEEEFREGHLHQDWMDKLRRLVKPFILRRQKNQVLVQLPEKIEEKRYIELSDEQKLLYATLFRQLKEGILSEAKAGDPFLVTHFFALLTKLKQICNHPALFLGDLDTKNHQSQKWDLLFELIENAIASEQKVVVFSQYVGMLSMISSELAQRGIDHAILTGEVKDRKQQVDRFQNDPGCKVFLGSILAAGVGIDLIAASILIHYDRWWNPAKEEQATARIHRMGQTKGVQIYKLITKNTVEEQIDALIERKKNLIADILDDGAPVAQLSREEIFEILEKLDHQIKENF